MRGQQERTGPLFSYVSTEERIPKAHPLRQVRRLADQALDRLNPTLCRLYPEGGRPSIPPEQLLLALLLQAIYSIRSERMRISGITPHVSQNIQPRRCSAIDGRTVRHPGYAQSINARKRIEQVFRWIKQAAGLRQLKARGRSRVGAVFRLHVVAYNLIRLANLLSAREALA